MRLLPTKRIKEGENWILFGIAIDMCETSLNMCVCVCWASSVPYAFSPSHVVDSYGICIDEVIKFRRNPCSASRTKTFNNIRTHSYRHIIMSPSSSLLVLQFRHMCCVSLMRKIINSLQIDSESLNLMSNNKLIRKLFVIFPIWVPCHMCVRRCTLYTRLLGIRTFKWGNI